MPPLATSPLQTAPLSELTGLLLKQFRRLLTEHGVSLSTEDIDAIATDRAQHALTPQIVPILAQLVADSETELHTRFGMTFAQALATPMDKISGWQTTAEFLELANHKSNAELRISASASLLAFLGDSRYTAHLHSVIADDDGRMDVDGVIAQRALESV
jgi:hypothetical protein